MGNWDIDWKPVIPTYSRGLDSLGEALARRRDYKLREKDSQQKAKFENDQNAAVMAGKKEQERRNKVKESQDQADRRLKLTQNLGGLLGKGLNTNAEAMAGASQFEDPSRPGETQGVTLKPVYDRPEPNAQLSAPGTSASLARFLQGQAMQPSAEDRAATLRQMAPPNETVQNPLEPPPYGREPPPQEAPRAAPPQPEPDPNAVEETTQALDFIDEQGRDDVNRTQRQARDASVQYEVGFPGGQTARIDPREQRRADRLEKEEAAKRYEDAALSEPDPMVRAQYMRVASQMRAGMGGQDKASVNNVATQEDAQAFKDEQGDKHDMTATQKHEIGMRPRAAPQSSAAAARLGQADERNEIQRAQYAQGLTKETLGRYGFSELQLSSRKFNNMAEKLAANPNPALDATIAGEFVKQAQGGTGVISDNDMNVFWGRIGDLQTKSWQRVHDIIDGRIEPEKRRLVLEAVKSIARITAGNMDNIGRAVSTKLQTDTVIGKGGSHEEPKFREQALDSYFPGLRARLDAEEAGGSAAPVPPPRRYGYGPPARPRKSTAPPAAAPVAPAAAPPPKAAPNPNPVLRLKDGRHVRKLPNGKYEEVSGG